MRIPAMQTAALGHILMTTTVVTITKSTTATIIARLLQYIIIVFVIAIYHTYRYTVTIIVIRLICMEH